MDLENGIPQIWSVPFHLGVMFHFYNYKFKGYFPFEMVHFQVTCYILEGYVKQHLRYIIRPTKNDITSPWPLNFWGRCFFQNSDGSSPLGRPFLYNSAMNSTGSLLNKSHAKPFGVPLKDTIRFDPFGVIYIWIICIYPHISENCH